MTEGQSKSTHDGLRFIKGEIVQRIEYTPFGKERYVLNASLSEGPKFTDQQNDIEDGLYFYQSRYYDPVLGRFVQPDNYPSDSRNPQTLNAYAYVLNNPLKYIDPTGHRIYVPIGPLPQPEKEPKTPREPREPNDWKDGYDRSRPDGALDGEGTVRSNNRTDVFGYISFAQDQSSFTSRLMEDVASFEDRLSLGEDLDFGKGFNIGADRKSLSLEDTLSHAYLAVVGAEIMALGGELIEAGIPLLVGGPAGAIAGAILIVHGIAFVGVGGILISDSSGWSYVFVPNSTLVEKKDHR